MNSRSMSPKSKKTKSGRKITDSPLVFSPNRMRSNRSESFKPFKLHEHVARSQKLELAQSSPKARPSDQLDITNESTDSPEGKPTNIIAENTEDEFITLPELIECIMLDMIRWEDLTFPDECYEQVLGIKLNRDQTTK